jgi:hypothetical protein
VEGRRDEHPVRPRVTQCEDLVEPAHAPSDDDLDPRSRAPQHADQPQRPNAPTRADAGEIEHQHPRDTRAERLLDEGLGSSAPPAGTVRGERNTVPKVESKDQVVRADLVDNLCKARRTIQRLRRSDNRRDAQQDELA